MYLRAATSHLDMEANIHDLEDVKYNIVLLSESDQVGSHTTSLFYANDTTNVSNQFNQVILSSGTWY